MKRKIEVWTKVTGELFTIEYNACGCCPSMVIKKWGNKYNEGVSYYEKNKSSHTKYLQWLGSVRLGTL